MNHYIMEKEKRKFVACGMDWSPIVKILSKLFSLSNMRSPPLFSPSFNFKIVLDVHRFCTLYKLLFEQLYTLQELLENSLL